MIRSLAIGALPVSARNLTAVAEECIHQGRIGVYDVTDCGESTFRLVESNT